MVYIINVLLIAISLSMDTFALSFSYGLSNLKKRTIIVTSIFVGLFHFFMPLLGNMVGVPLFEYTFIKPKIILFIVFLMLSIDMFISFFEKDTVLKDLNLLGKILFAFSVSFDSFSVGLGLNYIYDNILLSTSTFCIISFVFTILGFYLGKLLSQKIQRYSFLLGAIVLFMYSIYVLTK